MTARNGIAPYYRDRWRHRPQPLRPGLVARMASEDLIGSAVEALEELERRLRHELGELERALAASTASEGKAELNRLRRELALLDTAATAALATWDLLP